MSCNRLSSALRVCCRWYIVGVQPHCCESVQWYAAVADNFVATAIQNAMCCCWERPACDSGVPEDMKRERRPYAVAWCVILLAISCVDECLLTTATLFRWEVEDAFAPFRLTARTWTAPSSHASSKGRGCIDVCTWQRCATCVEALGKHLLAKHTQLNSANLTRQA